MKRALSEQTVETVSQHAAAAIIAALKKYNALQPKWISVLNRFLGGHGAVGLLRYQSDYRIDLLLRCLEDEAAISGEPNKEPEITVAIFVNDLKSALTRYWVFSTYEALRIAKNSQAGKPNAKLQALYERFRLIRIPLAKLEIANDAVLTGGVKLQRVGPGDPDIQEYKPDAKIEYHPVVLLNVHTGSLGWIVFDAATGSQVSIFRRELSDEFLALFD